MKIQNQSTLLMALFIMCVVPESRAASISFDSALYPGPGETISVGVLYDFTDVSAFGVGFNLLYDPLALEFVGYTQATWGGVGEPQTGAASPTGQLEGAGNYSGAGIGTFDFSGIYTAGLIGTFVFNVIGIGNDTFCGGLLCLVPDPQNPAADLFGNDITDSVFGNGITIANTQPIVPIPGAIWLMLSGLVALSVTGKKHIS